MNKGKIIFGAFTIFAGLSFAQEQPAAEQKSTAEVCLTQVDFKKNNCQNVGDALKTITGVYVNSEGEISLRDVSSSKVVVVLDGQRLNTAGSTGVNVAALSIENVEKIELLRGGRSAQFGADAVGGVILISTKTKTETAKALNTDFKATYGSFDRRILSLTNTYTKNNFNFILSYKRDLWDGDFDYINTYDQKDTLVNNHQSSFDIFFKAGAVLPHDQNLTASTYYYKADNGTPGMIDNPTPLARIRFNNNTYNLTYDKQNLFAGFSLKTQAYYLFFNTKFDNPEGIVPVHSDHKNYATGLDLQQAGNLFGLVNLSYGYTYRQDKIHSTDVGDKNRVTNSAYTTLAVTKKLNEVISNLDFSVAMRYDSPSDFNSAFSPRFSLSIGHSGVVNLGLISHYTRSYKAPSFNDLYWPRDAFAIGNPNLKPETGRNYDIGLTASYATLSLASNYFVNNVEDLILWAQDPAVSNLWTPKNISKTNTVGIENSATLTLFKGLLAVNGEYTYMKALDKSADPNLHNKFIIYRPKNKLDLTTTIRFRSFETNFIYHYVGLRYINAPNTRWLPSYRLFDLNATYRHKLLGLLWSATLELTNLTDESYMKVNGTAEPGRMSKFSFGFNF